MNVRSKHAALAGVGSLCVLLLVTLCASPLFSGGRQLAVLEEKDVTRGEWNYTAGDDVLGKLEEAMDHSIDDKVQAYLTLPQVAAMPVPEKGAEHYVDGADFKDVEEKEEKTYLERLQDKQEDLEKRKEELLDSLRSRRDHAAEVVAKGMIGMEANDLSRAVHHAEQRVTEESRNWGTLLANKEQQSQAAKRYAFRQKILAIMHNKELDNMLADAKAA